MKGTTHVAIGAAAGLFTANIYHTDPTSTMVLVGLGSIAGLVPDLDIDGKLSNKITLSKDVFRLIAQVIAIFIIGYSFFTGTGFEKWIGIGAGIMLFILAIFIRQRRMLTLTGIGVLIGGQALQEDWLWLLGIYLIIASFVSHRGYTHSILGAVFFAFISFSLDKSLALDGVSIACILGYVSHLITDMKFFPVNKRGIKLFLPFSKKEF
ncbi:metal-dependent hydrolase [Oceanobacillus bengalensis]|uniref:Metal-dependent hydrolase n=1 Tax=Oceanobacillus bengalensis TaxID=1435466 RepID=A0A494YZB8_9BACI|nr:metal-dependent hydrolase [Oceanobacillus bengalensis]RKQ15508.1 metal-dependent hydrolase [Oceanobacillus bengalensis]